METYEPKKCSAYPRKFKSYYVVWKPSAAAFSLRAALRFKSYYVVWKRGFHRKKKKNFLRFKSYYVVWKRECSRSNNFIFSSLNRTM